MGSFAGHALPGTFFLLFAVYWCIHITRRYVACRAVNVAFYSTVTYPCFMACSRLSFEGSVKVLVTLIGIIGELVASTEPLRSNAVNRLGDLNGVYMGDIQHVSMYLWFLLAGIVDILMNMSDFVYLPKGLDYVVSAMAFVAQLLLFYFHTHGQDQLEMTLHLLLLYVIAACVATVILEYNFPNSLIVSYARAYMVLLQGTWFYQIGFVLYPRFMWQTHWDGNSHENIMLATVIFSWHLAIDLVLLLLISGVTYHVSRKHFPVRNGSLEYVWTKRHSNVAPTAAGRVALISSSDESS